MSNSPVALEVVAAQIAGLEAELKRIDDQILALQARREGIVMMRRALAPLVDTTIIPGTASMQVNSMHDTSGPGTPLVMVARARGQNGSSLDLTAKPKGTGFRDAVRKVLRDYPKGLRPVELLAELTKRGELVKYTGKANPAARVHNELYSLRKSGALSRRAGKYTLIMQTDALI